MQLSFMRLIVCVFKVTAFSVLRFVVVVVMLFSFKTFVDYRFCVCEKRLEKRATILMKINACLCICNHFSPQQTNLAEGYCYPHSVCSSVRPSVNIWGAVVCPWNFGMKPLY